MNSERTQAYGRIVKTLADIGPTKLHGDEQSVIRQAADTLVFAERGDDVDVRAAVEDARGLAERLVSAGRWSDELADQLLDDLASCGPLTPVA